MYTGPPLGPEDMLIRGELANTLRLTDCPFGHDTMTLK
jgi:hypothetical protein